MRTRRLLALAAALALSGDYETVLASPLGTAFTYQGQLKDGGEPANGHYDFFFRVYAVESGGSQVSGNVAVSAVPVENGLFTVELDFDSFVFTGEERWLQVYVRDSDIGGEYIELSPRQPLNATPYALYALSGGNWSSNGSHIYNSNDGNVGVGTSDPADRLHVAGPDANLRLEQDPNDPGSYFQFRDTGTTQGTVDKYASSGNVILDINPMAADGVSSAALRLFRSTDTTGLKQAIFYRGNNTTSASAVIGMDGADSFFQIHGGGVGIGTTAPQGELHVRGDGAALILHDDGSPDNSFTILNDTAPTQVFFQKVNQSGSSLIAIDPMPEDGISDAYIRFFRGTSTTGTKAVLFNNGNGDTTSAALIGVDGADSWFQAHGGNFGIGTTTPTVKLDVAGEAKVEVLHITGADVAERFPVSETPDAVPPGTVMEIDPEHAGQLRIARGMYNRRVAGVRSGAGDLPAGTILGNLPGSHDAPPIALSGRVWVRCDASDHAIEIGDLLTTAKVSGHAMAVRDFSRAHGAVIGKAMTPLAQGETGLVLVLVNLH